MVTKNNRSGVDVGSNSMGLSQVDAERENDTL
jgi:hypothetical protein